MIYTDVRTTTDPFGSLLSHAEELIDAGRIRDARRLLAQFVDRKQVDGHKLPALAALYLRIGKPEMAINTMNRAINEVGRNPEMLNTLGLMFASLGREAESLAQFEAALELDSSDCTALRNLALTRHRSGDRAEAYALLIRCYRLTPLSAELRLICGTLLELDGRAEAAAACYHEVNELSTVYDHVRLASRRLLVLNRPHPSLSFEDVMEQIASQSSASTPS